MNNTSVLQDWLVAIPIRMQSTLVLSLRGPDTHGAPFVKAICRWLRGLAFKPGNSDNAAEFMGSMPDRILEKGYIAQELEFCTQHYYSHLMHGLEVVAYRHPAHDIRLHAFYLYNDMCALFHLPVEEAERFEKRLGSKVWPGGVQPDTFEDALALLTNGKGAEEVGSK